MKRRNIYTKGLASRDSDRLRLVAIYRRSTYELVCICPTWHAVESILPGMWGGRADQPNND